MSNIIDNKKHDSGPFNEKKIICNYKECYAGLGIAGRGICILSGNAYNKNCKKFKKDNYE
jgi:hypothetical protein